MGTEISWLDTHGGNPKYSEGNLFQCQFIHFTNYVVQLGSNPHLRVGSPATNFLNLTNFDDVYFGSH